MSGISLALFILRIIAPALVLLPTLALLFARPPAPAEPSPITQVIVKSAVPRRGLILALLSLVALTYLLDGLAFVIYAVIDKRWPYLTGIELNAIIGLVAFSGLASLGAYKDIKGVDVWSRGDLKVAVVLSLLVDVAQVVLFGASTPRDTVPHPYPLPFPLTSLLHFIFPVLRILLLVPLFGAFISPVVTYSSIEVDEPQPTTALLAPEASSTEPIVNGIGKYGTFRSTASGAPTASSDAPTRAHSPVPPTAVANKKKGLNEKDVNPDPSWRELGSRIKRITPYLWPSKSVSLQLTAALCIFILIVGRFVAFGVPYVLAELIAVFEKKDGRSPWPYLFGYVALRFLASSGGLAAIRDALWAPVMQYSDREMSELSFNHLLNLSYNWHINRKTGEVLRILDRGAAINHILELLLFTVIPTFIDIVVALVVFALRLDWTLSLLLFVVLTAYITASVVITRWRTKLRRQMNERDTFTRGIHTDCLLNYETVKYFGGEEHEGNRYREAIKAYQGVELRVILSMNLLNLVQNFIITLGLLVGSILVALQVVNGKLDASDFVYFITYLSQLYGPLNNLGYIYRSINQALIDTEKLLILLSEPTDVNDKPDAPDLVVTNGELSFENVSFSYDGGRSSALKGVSFTIPKGSSVALVGESGAGKSTILRLLYRFYDLAPGEGRITIDGQDIRDVTQRSLRQAIGVVPQDSVLFNASIGYNIGYGKFGASEEEIQDAAQRAQMHERIASFPDGYSTKVGERGIRLSGGEKQRVAIARTLLKNPPILLLDEATSALDTSTERDIQKALQNLVLGRSSLSIAHRLSTIANADLILVLKDGQVIEQGSHAQLLELGGVFAAMWADQISVEEHAASDVKVEGYDLEAEPQVKEEPTQDDAPPTQDTFVAEPEPEIVAPTTSDVPAVVAEPEPEVKEEETPAPVAFPTSSEPEPEAAPVAFPSSADDEVEEQSPEAPATAPIAFPASDEPETSSQAPTTDAPTSPGITFAPETAQDRERSPSDPDEPKRKRISSQNFQRLARRISVSARRTGSGNIPGIAGIVGALRREGSTPGKETPPRDSKDGDDAASASGSTSASPRPATPVRVGSTDSPAGSVRSDSPAGEGKKLKKEKKERRKTLGTGK